MLKLIINIYYVYQCSVYVPHQLSYNVHTYAIVMVANFLHANNQCERQAVKLTFFVLWTTQVLTK